MMARVWLRFCLATLLVVGATACSDEASSPAGGDAGDADVPVSEGPATLPDGQMAVVGKAYDYLTGAPVAGAFVSTFPPTVIVRTNADGEFVLTEGLSPGRVHEIKGEANGYERALAPARPVPGERVTVNLPLVPSDQAVPLRFEPAVLVFTSDVQELRVAATVTGEGAVTPAFEPPDWLTVATPLRLLQGGERQTITFRIAPDAFAAAIEGLSAGASLTAEVKVTDEFRRVGVLAAVAVPAPPGLVSVSGPADAVGVVVGTTVDVAVTARYAEQPLVGAVLRSSTDAVGAVIETPERTTGDDGSVVVRVRGETVGAGTLEVGLPAYRGVEPLRLALDVRAAESGPPSGGPCAVDNGRCGDPAIARCVPSAGGGRVCEDVNECDDDNGGCGAPEDGLCVNRVGAIRDCVDVDTCAPDETGHNRCGRVGAVICRDRDLLPPECVDLDMCATDNGGCGDPWHHRCVDEVRELPTCAPFDPCEPDALGETFCGPVAHATCIDHPGAEPTCVDVDECAPGPDGRNWCGVAGRWVCVNAERVAPECDRIDLCLTNYGNCGDPSRMHCVDHVDADPECIDIDECAVDNGGCGQRELNTCTNRRNDSPTCAPRDLCAPDDNLMNACGDARYTICTGAPGTYPECADRLECAVAPNGRNGCPGLARDWLCIERDGAPPDCLPCPDGFVNLDADPFSCEHACVAAGDEICNGRDDDCDGRVDNDFDLLRDPENCGACGHRCADAPGVEASTCQMGVCGALRCTPGHFDGDGDADSGCEADLPLDVLYVDAAADAAGADGSPAHPFRRIGDALAASAASPERTIAIAAGVYPECLTVDRPDTRLLGAGSDRVAIACDEAYGVWVTGAHRTLLSGLRLTTADQSFGLYVQNADDFTAADVSVVGYAAAVSLVSVHRATLRGVRVVDAGGVGGSTVGLGLSYATDVSIAGLEVEGVRIGTGTGAAVSLGVGCERIQMEGVRVAGVSGEAGTTAVIGLDVAEGVREAQFSRWTVSEVWGAEAVPGGAWPGGAAYGVRLGAGVEAVDITDLAVSEVRGGAGDANGGGAATGVSAARSNVLTFSEVDVRGVEGGAGAPAGAAVGIRLVEATGGSLRNALVWRVEAGAGPHDEVAGVSIDRLTETTLAAWTVAEIGGPDDTEASGVRFLDAADAAGAAVNLQDLLVSGVRGRCVQAPEGRARVRLGASLLHDCGDPPISGSYEAATEPLVDDPRFRDRDAGDLHLAGDSPAVDAAARASAFAREPAPNGGRADLGRYGNTPEATPSP